VRDQYLLEPFLASRSIMARLIHNPLWLIFSGVENVTMPVKKDTVGFCVNPELAKVP